MHHNDACFRLSLSLSLSLSLCLVSSSDAEYLDLRLSTRPSAACLTHFATSRATGTYRFVTVHFRDGDRMNPNHVRKSRSRISRT